MATRRKTTLASELAAANAFNAPGVAGLASSALRGKLIGPETFLKEGMYDPNLDFQAENQNLGFGFVSQDYNLGNTRQHEDVYGEQGFYADPVTNERHDFTREGALAGLERQKGESLADLLTRRQRGQADYERGSTDLRRGYQQLGSRQGDASRSAGLGVGANQQSLRRRLENRGREQGAMDTNWRQFVQDNDTQVQRVNEGTDRARGDLLSGAGRTQQDRDLGYQRAGSAHVQFHDQLGRAKVGSAQQMGTLPFLPPPDVDPPAVRRKRPLNASFASALAAAGRNRGLIP